MLGNESGPVPFNHSAGAIPKTSGVNYGPQLPQFPVPQIPKSWEEKVRDANNQWLLAKGALLALGRSDIVQAIEGNV